MKCPVSKYQLVVVVAVGKCESRAFSTALAGWVAVAIIDSARKYC